MSQNHLSDTPPPLPPLPPLPPPPIPVAKRRTRNRELLKVASLAVIIKQFPVALICYFIAMFAFATSVGLPDESAGADWLINIGVAAMAGAIWSLAINVLSRRNEAFGRWRTIAFIVVAVVCAAYVPLQHYCNVNHQISCSVGASIILGLSLLFFPIAKNRPALRGWFYSWYVIGSAVMAFLISSAVCLSFALILVFLTSIIGAPDELVLSAMIFVSGLSFAYLFLGRLALYETSGDAERRKLGAGAKVLYKASVYALLPLMGIAACVVLTYFFTLVATLEMPSGPIARIVAMWIAGVLILFFCVYPYSGKLSADIRLIINKVIPVMTIALLLVLGFVSVGETLSNGVTATSIYRMGFTIVSLALFTAILMGKVRRVCTVPLTYAFVYWAVSFIPYVNVSYLSDKEEIAPVIEEEAVINTVLVEERDSAPQIPDKLDEVSSPRSAETNAVRSDYQESRTIKLTADATIGADIPVNVQRVRSFRLFPSDPVKTGERVTVSHQGFTATLPMDSLASLDPDSRFKPVAVDCDNSKGSYMVFTYLAIEDCGEGEAGPIRRIADAEGYLFTRKKYKR